MADEWTFVAPKKSRISDNDSRKRKKHLAKATNEIKEALNHSLLEWGADSDQLFQKKILQKGTELASLLSSSDRDSAGRTSNKNVRNKDEDVSPSPICFDHLRPNKFPRDIQSAYELTLRSDVESLADGMCILYEDRLQDEINGFGEPYFKWIDKSYKLKREYTGIASHRLNPLYRYTFERHTKPSFLFKCWFTNEDVESDMGTFLEACWSCHAIQKESCFHCNSRNSLRWSGGFGSSWQDLVCVECRCMYELKTKASMEKIESIYHHNNLNSGSFHAYCQIERARRVDDPNGHRHKVNSGGGRPTMFLVLLPRTFTINRKRQKVHPVFIAEIDTIIPKLSETNFNPDKEKVSFKSRTTMNLRSKTKWFDLPFSGEDVDLPATKKKIYIECFGQEVFNACGGAGGGDEGASSGGRGRRYDERLDNQYHQHQHQHQHPHPHQNQHSRAQNQHQNQQRQQPLDWKEQARLANEKKYGKPVSLEEGASSWMQQRNATIKEKERQSKEQADIQKKNKIRQREETRKNQIAALKNSLLTRTDLPDKGDTALGKSGKIVEVSISASSNSAKPRTQAASLFGSGKPRPSSFLNEKDSSSNGGKSDNKEKDRDTKDTNNSVKRILSKPKSKPKASSIFGTGAPRPSSFLDKQGSDNSGGKTGGTDNASDKGMHSDKEMIKGGKGKGKAKNIKQNMNTSSAQKNGDGKSGNGKNTKSLENILPPPLLPSNNLQVDADEDKDSTANTHADVNVDAGKDSVQPKENPSTNSDADAAIASSTAPLAKSTSRPKLKLVPRTKPVPKLEIDPHYKKDETDAKTKSGVNLENGTIAINETNVNKKESEESANTNINDNTSKNDASLEVPVSVEDKGSLSTTRSRDNEKKSSLASAASVPTSTIAPISASASAPSTKPKLRGVKVKVVVKPDVADDNKEEHHSVSQSEDKYESESSSIASSRDGGSLNGNANDARGRGRGNGGGGRSAMFGGRFKKGGRGGRGGRGRGGRYSHKNEKYPRKGSGNENDLNPKTSAGANISDSTSGSIIAQKSTSGGVNKSAPIPAAGSDDRDRENHDFRGGRSGGRQYGRGRGRFGRGGRGRGRGRGGRGRGRGRGGGTGSGASGARHSNSQDGSEAGGRGIKSERSDK